MTILLDQRAESLFHRIDRINSALQEPIHWELAVDPVLQNADSHLVTTAAIYLASELRGSSGKIVGAFRDNQEEHSVRKNKNERNPEQSVPAPRPANVARIPENDVANVSDAAQIKESQIRDLAFRLYEERGCRSGHDLEDWLEAESIISSQAKAA